MMVVFELPNAKKYSLCSGVAPQTPIPQYPTGQQKCFWIPMMLVFEMHNARKYHLCSFCGGAQNTHSTVPHWPAKAFLDTYDGGYWTAQCQKTLFGIWGGASNTIYHCTLTGRGQRAQFAHPHLWHSGTAHWLKPVLVPLLPCAVPLTPPPPPKN